MTLKYGRCGVSPVDFPHHLAGRWGISGTAIAWQRGPEGSFLLGSTGAAIRLGRCNLLRTSRTIAVYDLGGESLCRQGLATQFDDDLEFLDQGRLVVRTEGAGCSRRWCSVSAMFGELLVVVTGGGVVVHRIAELKMEEVSWGRQIPLPVPVTGVVEIAADVLASTADGRCFSVLARLGCLVARGDSPLLWAEARGAVSDLRFRSGQTVGVGG